MSFIIYNNTLVRYTVALDVTTYLTYNYYYDLRTRRSMLSRRTRVSSRVFHPALRVYTDRTLDDLARHRRETRFTRRPTTCGRRTRSNPFYLAAPEIGGLRKRADRYSNLGDSTIISSLNIPAVSLTVRRDTR